jgi:rSAM/selenodomain-associated transferase 1
VIAKSPQPGRVKTRLCPPCSDREASEIAAAALSTTLEAVACSDSTRRVIALDGPAGPWLPPGFEVIPQRGNGLAQRLAAAFAEVGGPAVAVGMDSPQVTPDLLNRSFEALDEVDSALGPTPDGGYWAIALRRANDEVFAEVPMSVATTFQEQHGRLQALGLSCRELSELHDVDHFSDALEVAETMPGSAFAAAVRSVSKRLEAAS